MKMKRNEKKKNVRSFSFPLLSPSKLCPPMRIEIDSSRSDSLDDRLHKSLWGSGPDMPIANKLGQVINALALFIHDIGDLLQIASRGRQRARQMNGNLCLFGFIVKWIERSDQSLHKTVASGA